MKSHYSKIDELSSFQYGSIQYLRQKTRETKRKRRVLSKRNEVQALEIPKRSTLNPVEYSLRNIIIARTEEKLLDKVTKDMAELRRNGWRLLSLSPPLSESDRRRLELYMSCLKSRVEARKQQSGVKGIAESVWNITEEIEDIDHSTYQLMKKLGTSFIIKDSNINEEENGEIIDSNHLSIKWNPITIIQKYRCSVDPFRHLDFPMDFYAKVVGKHDYIYTQYLSKNYKVLKRAFEIIDRYRKQFSNRNYRYTLYEWFWIVRYAQVFTPTRASRMLLALDGGDGRISPEHIKDMVRPIMEFWEDFFYYIPHFFNFLKNMHLLIENDPDLKLEYEKIMERTEQNNENYSKEMLEEHFKTLQLEEDNDVIGANSINDYYLGTNNDNFKAGRIGSERVRIHHSNSNYQKEMEEFRNGLSKEKPKKKISCTFSPSLLPMNIRIKLHKEGKVPIIQT